MLNVDESALECDLAETYRIYDYRELPIERVALFSVGLREDSRIKMKIRNQKITLEQTLFASILDRLSLLCWLNSEDGQNNKNRPKSILSMLNGEKENDNEDLEVFDSVEDFERELQRLKEEAQKHE